MKQTETNEFVAQGAATWQEREEHDRIMKALDNVRGFVDSYFLHQRQLLLLVDQAAARGGSSGYCPARTP